MSALSRLVRFSFYLLYRFIYICAVIGSMKLLWMLLRLQLMKNDLLEKDRLISDLELQLNAQKVDFCLST